MSSPLLQAKDVWGRMPMTGRLTTIAAVLATIGMIAAIVYYGSQPDYRVLFSDLKPEEAQTIVEKLKTANVAYSLSNGGTTISVPADRVPELRLQMAGEGVLTGGHVGFDLFDKTNFGATDFAQKVNYRRAIEGELSKTLEAMDELEAVRVHITPKKESVFTEKEEGAKASVMVRVKQGKELSSERTDAIVSLIASSVEGLDAGNVSVMDTRGRLLTAGGGKPGSTGEAGAFNAQLEAKRKFEVETAARVITLLEPITGEGHVRADVASDVDFSKVEQTEEKYTPQSQIVRSQQTSQESRNTNSKNPAGVAGARSNDPTSPAAATGANPPAQQNQQSSGDQRTTSTVNYEIDKTTRRTLGGGGRVNRLNVSVLVDHKTVNDVTVARTNDELQQIQQLVTAAVGVDTNRGDTVVVQTLPFDKPQQLEANAPSWLDNNKPFLTSLAKYAAMVVVALLLLFFVIRPARKAIKVALATPASPRQLSAGEMRRRADDMDPNQSMMTVAELEAQMRSGDPSSAISHTAQRSESIRKSLVDQTLAQPDLVAGTLRGWLRE